MQYRIRGANRDTGQKISPFVVTADSEDEALAIAAERGTLVTSLTPTGSLHQQSPRYPALQLLSQWYAFIAVLNAIGAGILCLYLFADDQYSILIATALYGVVSTLTMIAFSQGIRLAIDVESHLRAIRRRSELNE